MAYLRKRPKSVKWVACFFGMEGERIQWSTGTTKVILQLFLPKTSGRENPDLVAQYEEALEGYLFKDVA